jgi:UDP-N-acetylglucosamine--N-acetylmuramyl-(pentapeptide) pyrophosphoryl-undecaprenol N-acetylglucosamine transferase
MTISELAATGTPAVVVPLEAVGQQANAAALERAGGARVLAQSEIHRLPEVVGGLAADAGRLDAMAAAGRRFARPEAAERVAEVVLEAADG